MLPLVKARATAKVILRELSESERKLVTDFITYFLAQWGPGSHAAQWYAGAHPFSLTNNQVLFCFPYYRKFII